MSHVGEDKMYTEDFSGEKIKETNCLEDLGIVGRIILKYIL